MKILIVEDSPAQAESLQMLLSAYGHVAYKAASAVGARGIAEVHPPDAVILDWIMPGGGALALISWLRQREATASVPVVISTGLPPESIELPPDVPGVTILQKPFTLTELLDALGTTETPPPAEPRGEA